MDITFYNDGNHAGSGLGTNSNGPVPLPGTFNDTATSTLGTNDMPASSTPVEPSTRIDGLADQGYNDNGANPSAMPSGGMGSGPSYDNSGGFDVTR